MTRTRLIAASVALAMGLLGVGLWAQGGETQTFRRTLRIGPDGQVIAGEPRSVESLRQDQVQTGTVISGDELGFRLRGVSPGSGTVTGTFVVKIGDDWYEVTSPMELRPAVR